MWPWDGILCERGWWEEGSPVTLGEARQASATPLSPSSIATHSPGEGGYHFGLASCRSRDNRDMRKNRGITVAVALGLTGTTGWQACSGRTCPSLIKSFMKNNLAFELK